MTRTTRSLAGCTLLAVLVLATFSPALTCDFVLFDDNLFVTENPVISQGLTWEAVKWAFAVHPPSQYHPLTWLSHALDVTLFGLHPMGHHAVSVLLHAANVCLLFLLLRRATGSEGTSFAAAAVFAVHPLRVESVVWVAERKDVLAMLLGLGCLLAYVGYTATGSRRRYLVMLLLATATLLAKPIWVTLAALVLLLDFWPLARLTPAPPGSPGARQAGTKAWQLLAEKLPLVVLAAGTGVLTVLTHVEANSLPGLEKLGVLDRLANAIHGAGWYLARTVWPAGLAAFHPQRAFAPGATVAMALLLVAVTALAVAQHRRRPWLVVGWLWFGVALLPVIGLVQAGDQWVADRYSYLPSIGLLVALVWTGADLADQRGMSRKYRHGVVALVLVVCTILTWRQIGFWRTSESLFRRAVAVDPAAWAAHVNLGSVLQHRGDTAAAEVHFRQAVRLRPDMEGFRLNLVELLAGQGRIEEALGVLRAGLEFPPIAAPQQVRGGFAAERLGDTTLARTWYGRALTIEPGNVPARDGLARVSPGGRP